MNKIMPLHTCELCSYSTKHKSSFQKHLLSKKHILRTQLHESSSVVNSQSIKHDTNILEKNVNENDVHATEVHELKRLLETSMRRIEILEEQNLKYKKFMLSLKESIDDVEEQQNEQYEFNIKMVKLMKKNQKQFERLSGFESGSDEETREIII